MVQSKATTVEEYLASLPAERREVIVALRQQVLDHLPEGYVETMNWGMICYEIPLARYPNTYNKQPLLFAAIAAQKNHHAIYLTCVYQDPKLETILRSGFEKAGKKLDMGKSCVRFQSLDQLELETIGQILAATSVEHFIASYEAARSTAKPAGKAKPKSQKKPK
ncbi:MAG: DUF1801 domain-containing protein [Isosphaeraceae bacterium]